MKLCSGVGGGDFVLRIPRLCSRLRRTTPDKQDRLHGYLYLRHRWHKLYGFKRLGLKEIAGLGIVWCGSLQTAHLRIIRWQRKNQEL